MKKTEKKELLGKKSREKRTKKTKTNFLFFGTVVVEVVSLLTIPVLFPFPIVGVEENESSPVGSSRKKDENESKTKGWWFRMVPLRPFP